MFTNFQHMITHGETSLNTKCLQWKIAGTITKVDHKYDHREYKRQRIPSWAGAMSTSQRAVTPCGWEVTAGMVRIWVAGKTVWSHCYTRAISERFRDKGLIIMCYINSSVYFTFTLPLQWLLLTLFAKVRLKITGELTLKNRLNFDGQSYVMRPIVTRGPEWHYLVYAT